MSSRIKVGFIILHYQAIDDTIEAVETLCGNIDTDEFHIVIVDNASPNKTGEVLSRKYQSDEKITVICNKTNEGFARGNNLGFRYLKSSYQVDYIVMMNNDIVFTEKDFLKKIEAECNQTGFDILGPLILTADGKYTSSPIRTKPIKREEVEFAIKEYKKNLVLNRFYLWNFYNMIKKVKHRKKVTPSSNAYRTLQRQENVQIHGCFMVFSREYIKKEDGLCDKTFLYCEEDILYLSAIKKGYKIIYQPSIMIYHKEDASTDYSYRKDRDKNIFYYTEALKSERLLLGMIEESNS